MKLSILKNLGYMLTITLVVNTLAGCASLAQQQTIQAQCTTSRVLMTDLTQTSASKTMLPSGEACPHGAI